MLQNVRFTRCLATRPSLFGKGVIMKTPGVRHSAGHSEFPDPRCPQPVSLYSQTQNNLTGLQITDENRLVAVITS
jgi:hypothetical protein